MGLDTCNGACFCLRGALALHNGFLWMALSSAPGGNTRLSVQAAESNGCILQRMHKHSVVSAGLGLYR